MIPAGEANIFPELANLFGFGCFRRAKPILSLNTAIKTWNRAIKDDMEGFICGLLTTRPRYWDLLQKLGERSRDPLKPQMLPITRSILYFSVVQNRFETFYQYEPRDKFISSSLPAVVSLSKLPDLPLLMQDFVQVYCCNVARQRRFLPDLLEAWDGNILNNPDIRDLAGHRSICWFNHFRDILALDLIILFGNLKLLSEAEEVQAGQLILLLFEKFKSEGKDHIIPNLSNDLCEECEINVIRWKHRWSLISKTICKDIPGIRTTRSVLNWYRTMVRMGLSGFSLVQPDWSDENFSTPPAAKTVGTVFTMYTTEREEYFSESE